MVSCTTVSPLPRRLSGRSRMVHRGGLFSVALSRGSPRVAVSHHLALRSPDVPRRRALPGNPGSQHRRDRLTDSSVVQHRSSTPAGVPRGLVDIPPTTILFLVLWLMSANNVSQMADESAQMAGVIDERDR